MTGIALGVARVLPLALAERRDRTLQRVVEVGILPDRPLPDVAEQRCPVELLALKADIGRHIGRRRLEDRLGLEFAQICRDRIELARRARPQQARMSVLPFGGLGLVQ
jgi:hypothetical protein